MLYTFICYINAAASKMFEIVSAMTYREGVFRVCQFIYVSYNPPSDPGFMIRMILCLGDGLNNYKRH